MDASGSAALARLVTRAQNDPDVLAVILFGSRARATASVASDHDVCLLLAAPLGAGLDATEKRLEYLALGDLDVVVFAQLPLSVRHRVLREGQVMFVRDEDALYNVAIRAARAFEAFRHIHRAHLEEVARG